MKKTSSPTRSCSHLLLTVTALLFLSIPTNAQWKTHQIFHNGIRLNDSGALSLHPNIPFEIDEPNVVGGRFRVTTTGLVGIGVADPKARLSFNNTYEPKISLYQSGEDMFGFATSKHLLEYHVVDINAAHVFYRDRSPSHEVQKAELMRISGSGNVGIGVTAPTEKLDVNGSINVKERIISKTVSTKNLIISKNFQVEPGSNFVVDEEIGGKKVFGGRFIILDNGNIGIGVTAPTEKLQVAGNIKATGLSLGDFKITPDIFGKLDFRGKDYNSPIRIEKGFLSLHPDAAFKMDAANIVGGRFTIGKDGNVGIGVTAPTEKLQVAGNIKATGKIIADGGIEMNGSEALHFSKEGNVGIGVADPKFPLDVAKAITSSKLPFGWVTQFKNTTTGSGVHLGGRKQGYRSYGIIGSLGTTSLTINPDGGNVGIGLTTPNAELHVAGDIKATGKIIADGGIALNNISESMYFAENGDVGIGVTAPTEKLQVAGNIKATGKIIADGGIQMNGSEALSFSNDGNVGIGIETPGFVIDVRATEANPSIVGWTSAFINEITDSGIHLGGRERDVEGVKTPYGIVGTYKTTPMVLNPDGGNVGIGVTAPTEKLQVAGNIKATGNLLLENDDDPDDPIPVFQVSTAEQLTFIGSEAYTKWTENNTNKDSELYKNKDKYSLWVSKGIVSEDYVMASVDAWADYVFDPGYKLRSLEELSHFVRTNKHLPNIPSEAEVKQEGYSLHELNRGFLKTIEELTLHTIAQEEKITTLEAQLEQYEHLSDEVAQLKAALAQLQQDQD